MSDLYLSVISVIVLLSTKNSLEVERVADSVVYLVEMGKKYMLRVSDIHVWPPGSFRHLS